MTYARRTTVPVDQTRVEIERTLVRYGARSFAYFNDQKRASVMFESNERRIRFDLPLPPGEKEKDQKLRRSKWRALLLCIKAKLESVESEIETFEEAFMAHVIMPDGRTVGEHAIPRIAAAYQNNEVVPLLPGPK